MCSANQVQLVTLVELLDHVVTKNVAHSSVVVSPTLDVVFRIRPKEVAKKACVWDFLWSMLLVDYLEVVQIWTQSTMHSEYTIVNNGSHWKLVEADTEVLPDPHVVTSFAFVVKSIHSVDGSTLVVSSEHEESGWISDFVSEQQADGLNTLLASINVISNKQVFLNTIWVSSNFEQSEEIKVLAVNVSEDLDWCFNLEKHLLAGIDLG